MQAPPNLSPDDHELLLRAGINDWGGISPLTPDYVNPEAPWPHVDRAGRHAAARRATGSPSASPSIPATSTQPGGSTPALRPRVTAAIAAEARSAAPAALEASPA